MRLLRGIDSRGAASLPEMRKERRGGCTMKPEEIKQNLNRRVRYRSKKTGVDAEYTLTGAIFRRKANGKFFYQAELQDTKNKNSVVIASIAEVEAMPQ